MKSLNTNAIVLAFALIGFSSGAHAAAPSHDTRKLIEVDAEAKAHVLEEMRQLLETVQLIMGSALEKDMDAVSRHASRVGLQAMKATPANVASQLPKEFKLMGRGVHEAMDGMARDARDLGDRDHTLEQLNTTLQGCVACHQMFKF